MDDFGPLLGGYDASSQLRHPDVFGVTTGRATDPAYLHENTSGSGRANGPAWQVG